MTRSKSLSEAIAVAVGAVGADLGRVAARGQPLVDEARHPGLVLDDQDPLHRAHLDHPVLAREPPGRSAARCSNRAPSPGPARDPDPPAVRLGDRAHDREPDPGALVAAAAVEPAREAREDPPLLARRDPGAGVADPDRRLGRRRRSRRCRSRRRRSVWATAFWARFMTAWVSRWRSATIERGDASSSCQRAVGDPARLGDQLLGELAQRHRLELEEVRALGLRQQQQVVDEAVHPVELAGDQGDRLAAVGLVARSGPRRAARGGRARPRSASAARG